MPSSGVDRPPGWTVAVSAFTTDGSPLELAPMPAGAGSPAIAPRGTGELQNTSDPGPGYREFELCLCGHAAIYTGPATGSAIPGAAGNPYATRLVGRFPDDVDRFSGRVFVEPFNTTRAGIDTDIAWEQLAPLLRAQGDGWVGVTVRTSAVRALKSFDPGRYRHLSLPTNDYEWDVLRHVGDLLKRKPDLGYLGGADVKALYMAGYSQSGADSATFAMAIHDHARGADRAHVFDGYLPSAHSGSLTKLKSGDSVIPSFENVPMTATSAPVIDLETQTDVEGFIVELGDDVEYRAVGGAHVRRNDANRAGDRYRLYEIAGAPHIGQDPGCLESSSFPTEAFVRAAAMRMIRWSELDIVPPMASRILLAVADDVSVASVDETGNALGGVRSPFVDVPLSTYHVHAKTGGLYMLTGNETLLSPDVLHRRYGSVRSYVELFTASLDQAVDAGYLLPMDSAQILATQEERAQRAFAG